MKYIYSLFLIITVNVVAQTQPHMYEIANCGGETRMALYTEQLSNVMWCLKGDVKFKESIILKYSKDTRVNLDSLEAKGVAFRKVVTKTFWKDGVGVARLDTKPNEDGSIWFDRVYVTEDGKGTIKVLAACKVIIEGTDPVLARINPKIQDIIITTDKKALAKYNALLKQLMTANNVKPLPPAAKNTGSKDETPPPVERLKN